MSSILDKITSIIVGVIGIIVVASVVASTNSGVVGSTAWTVLGFVTVGFAVAMLVLAFSAAKGSK